jgi:hypothetical protein
VTAVSELPDPATLTASQLQQTHCALCHQALATLPADRPIGTVRAGEGIHERDRELWACAPDCATN